jgi:hypothetical protein
MWKIIKNFDEYEINEYGVVRNISTKKVNNQYASSGKMKYFQVNLRFGSKGNRKGKPKDVHRLVAETFIPRVEGKKWVNHIDNDPHNNHVDNLEWVTPKENVHHSLRQGRMRPENGLKRASEVNLKPVYQYDKSGILLNKFDSMLDATASGDFQQSDISRVCNGDRNRKTHKGYIWSFERQMA